MRQFIQFKSEKLLESKQRRINLYSKTTLYNFVNNLSIIEIEKKIVMNGAKIVENIFFTVTCVSVFTCIVRSDYNFAMGLLSYYMIKNIG